MGAPFQGVPQATSLLVVMTESRHKLSRMLFFGNRARFRGYDLRAMMSRATALALLSNCVVAWNTLQLNRSVAELRRAGHDVGDEVLAGLSPFKTAHIQLHGIYRFDREPVAPAMSGGEIAHNHGV